MLTIYFFGQILSQNVIEVVSKDCYTCSIPNFFVFLDGANSFSGTWVLEKQTQEYGVRSVKFSEGYRSLICAIINLQLYLKSHYSIDALHWLLQKWNVTSAKYEKH